MVPRSQRKAGGGRRVSADRPRPPPLPRIRLQGLGSNLPVALHGLPHRSSQGRRLALHRGQLSLSLSPRPHPAQPVLTVPQSAITPPQPGTSRPFTQVAESWSSRLPLRSGLAKASLSPHSG
ncbi:unnamed protein product [Pipistrellus nathusii]|uniref:Uncharacterized protein n=1 Tax=Pipistrellus nathusii TaxID=59473 RepID=A0ABN9ZFR5_PIPNA